MRRALRRRPLRPEVKYIDSIGLNQTVASGQTSTFIITPQSMASGSAPGQRIGQEIKTRYVKIRHNFLAPPITFTSGLVATDNYVRYVLWTPRVDSTVAINYMSGLGYLTNIDFNVVTVVKDISFRMSRSNQPVFNSTGTTVNGYEPNGEHMTKLLRLTIPFPRTCKFAYISGGDSFDVDKDVLYCSIKNNFGNGPSGSDPAVLNHAYNTRLTYVDN